MEEKSREDGLQCTFTRASFYLLCLSYEGRCFLQEKNLILKFMKSLDCNILFKKNPLNVEKIKVHSNN